MYTDDIEYSLGEEEVWEDEGSEDDDSEDEALPDLEESSTFTKETALTTWLLLFLLRLQAKHYIPDTAITSLLKFLYAFLQILSSFCSSIKYMVSVFPSSLYKLRKFFKIREEFTRYVVCPKCYSVYTVDEHCGTFSVSKLCSFRKHQNARLICKTPLLKTVRLLNGKQKLCPFKVYCYGGLERSLQRLLSNEQFSMLCDHWRSRNSCDDRLEDIYDRQLWKDFQYQNGQPCLAAPYTFALMLNVDWFQPFKHSKSSVGAIDNHDSGYLGMAVQLYVQAHLGHYHILTQKEYSQKLMAQLKSTPLFTPICII